MKNNGNITAMIGITVTIVVSITLATWAIACEFKNVNKTINDNNVAIIKEMGEFSSRVSTLEQVFIDIKKSPNALNKAITNLKQYAFNE